MSRTLSLELPECLYRAIAEVAAREGLSLKQLRTTWSIDAITRRAERTAPTQDRLRIVWGRPLPHLHSMSQVNREVCLRFIGTSATN